MKQRITAEQMNELTNEQKQRLCEANKTKTDPLTIGEMIELLNDGDKRVSIVYSNGEWEAVAHSKHASINPELCDALWNIIKKVL
ncbi:hypothetical protein D3C76_1576030 [compost metagenome]